MQSIRRMFSRKLIAVLSVAICLHSPHAQVAVGTFINFETAPIHPMALSPDHSILALCNLPDGRLELFDAKTLTNMGSIAVGIDPVTVRFRTDGEVWVVNHISDTIN